MPILATLVCIIAGMMIVYSALPLERKDPAALAFLLCAGAGVGAGVTSVLCFLLLNANMAGYAVFIDPAFAALLVLLLFFLYKRGLPAELTANKSGMVATTVNRILAVVFCGAFVSSAVSLVAGFLREPHGRWDAWLIWNMHARFIYRSGDNWREMFNGGLDWTHADYPLMLPLSVVRTWIYQGGESVFAPMLLAALFALAVVGLLASSLAFLRSRSQGLLAGLALMGSPFFLTLTVYQVADIPLAFFILATLVYCYMSDREENYVYRALLLAGVAAGLACWTKNEGLLFAVSVVAGRLALMTARNGWRSSLRQTAWLMAGAAPVLLVVAAFKTGLAPPNDLFSGQPVSQIVERLADPHRYIEIMKAFFLTAATFTQGVVNIRSGITFNPAVVGIALLAVYMAMTGVIAKGRQRSAAFNALAIPLIMLAGFFAVYVLTPHDLRWHLLTSLNRLFMQVWPGLIFVCFALARTPEEAFAQPEARTAAAGRKAGQAGPGKHRAHAVKGGR